MKYLKSTFEYTGNENFVIDVLVAELADIGYDSFQQVENQLQAYINESIYDKESLRSLLQEFPFAGIRYLHTESCEDKDWNVEWEKNFFQPIIIADRCVIHSPFHTDLPLLEYDITINPKMAFGTGHHQTTSLILAELLETELQGLDVLDMGCGTGILGMLAALRGAKTVTAIDIDDWCTENTKENISLNEKLAGATIEVATGDASLLAGKAFDVILANINRNILLNDLSRYVRTLRRGGIIIMSGFYEEDIPLLLNKCTELGLCERHRQTKDRWAMLVVEQR